MKSAIKVVIVLAVLFLLPNVAQAVERGYTGYENFDGLSMKPFYKYPDSFTYENIQKFYGERKGLAEELKRQRIERMRNRYGHKDYNEFKPGRSVKKAKKQIVKTSKNIKKEATKKVRALKKLARKKTNSLRKKGRALKAKGSMRTKAGKGVLVDLAIAVSLGMHNEMKKGQSAGDAMRSTFDSIKEPSFLFGHLLGGAAGAAVGSLVPVPALSGVLGGAMKSLPVIGGAMLVGSLASNAIALWQEGNLTVGNLLQRVDFLGLTAQMTGASLGAALGSVLIPIPGLGSIVGGVLGGLAFDKILSLFRGKVESEERIEAPDSTLVKADFASGGDEPSAPTSGCTILEAKEMLATAYEDYIKSVGSNNEQLAFGRYVAAKENYQAQLQATAN